MFNQAHRRAFLSYLLYMQRKRKNHKLLTVILMHQNPFYAAPINPGACTLICKEGTQALGIEERGKILSGDWGLPTLRTHASVINKYCNFSFCKDDKIVNHFQKYSSAGILPTRTLLNTELLVWPLLYIHV